MAQATEAFASAADEARGDVLSWASRELRAHASVSSVLIGCLGVGAAMVIGVGELAVGAAVGYAAYLVLADGESPIRAMCDALALVERGDDETRPR